MAKQTENQIKAQKILDYWYTIEFLAQDKYDDMLDIRTKMHEAQKGFANGKFRGKAIWSYRELEDSQSIYDIVLADAVSCGMKKWGNITVYIGKVKREKCIECITKVLPNIQEEVRPEKTYDNIAWSSLQIAPDGTYVDHSLSLSTIIWSMNQVKNRKSRLSADINENQYRSAVEDIEMKFFSREKEIQQLLAKKETISEKKSHQKKKPHQKTWNWKSIFRSLYQMQLPQSF